MIKKDEIEKFYKIDYLSKDVDIYIERLFKGLGFNNISEFENHLSQNNIEINELRRKLVIEKSWNSLIFEIYNQKVVINKNEILKNLDEITKKILFKNHFNYLKLFFQKKIKKNIKKNTIKLFMILMS